jgi:hypothetical protein
MDTNTLPSSSNPHRGRRRVVFGALATVAVLGVAGGALVATSSSSATTPQVTIGRAQTGPVCTVDFGYLAAELETMPADVRTGVIAALSPATQQLVDIALSDEANTAVGGQLYGFKYTPPVPDGATLGRILAEIPAGDARAVESGLSPATLSAIGTPEPGRVASGPACP